MSKASYKKNPTIVNYVKCRWEIGGKVMRYTHINYAKSKDEARNECMKNTVWAKLPTFEIVSVRTYRR